MKIITRSWWLSVAMLAAWSATGSSLRAQDNGNGGEPVMPGIDPATLTYDYLVDGNLAVDDPVNKKFKTLQAAYAAAPAGTAAKQTVIGIMPNVYQITGTASTAGLTITKNFLTLLGLTNNRRSVVLADNRGNKQGAGSETTSNNGIVIAVSANGFTAQNLTFLNYCNVNYEYPGDPSKNLPWRSGVITQAVALQASGDKHVYVNVAILSRLDTMFLQTTRAYLKNVYIEGTDDFVGGGTVSYWDTCEIHFPTGNGVPSYSGCVFANTKFISSGGCQFYKSAGSPVALINCTLPVHTPQAPVAWVRGKAPPRPNLYSLTYHCLDANGGPAVIIDSDRSTNLPTFTYSREISDQEALAFNPWNVLRATPTGAADDWDPAGVKALYDPTFGSLIFRMSMSGGSPSIRTGGAGATIGATVNPARAPNKTITWSTTSPLITLSSSTGASIVVTGHNLTNQAEYVKVNATAVNGFYVSAWVFVEPTYIDPPAVLSGPTLSPPSAGLMHVNYTLDLGGREDQSLISWFICDDALGTNPRGVGVSRGNLPLQDLTLTLGYIGKYIKATIQPKHNISDPGPAVSVVATTPIVAADIVGRTVSPNFRNFVTTTNTTYASGLWTVLGSWTSSAGDSLVNGYGVRVGSQGASLLYYVDRPFGDMQIDLVMTPEKTAGQGFGSPGSGTDGNTIQKSDIYIKYDPVTMNGYSLRYWRTTQSAEKVMFQFYKIVDGAGSPLDSQQVLTGVFKPNTYLTLKVEGSTISANAFNDVPDDSEVLSLTSTITPNAFGGAGAYWSGTVSNGNSNVYSLFEISYPDRIAPVLSVPSNLVLEATGPSGAIATFAATAVDDVDGSRPVTFNFPSGSVFPLGVTLVTASASDLSGNTSTGTFTVTVRDTTPPAWQSLTASPNVLGPVNHKLIAIVLTANVADVADPAFANRILSVTCNQPINGTGDGNTAPDYEITGALTLNLRAERAGNKGDRIYTITVESRDRTGNASTSTVNVTVPHN